MYTNMNESLLKSFDNLMHQQTKMDHKAYIFMGFLAIIYNITSEQNNLYINISLCVFAVPLLISLLPRATNLMIKITQKMHNAKKIEKSHNIFYYLDIASLSNEQFIQVLKDEYDITEITKSDSKLIEQITINAKILKTKIFWHTSFQYLIVLLIIILIMKYICLYFN